MSPPLTKFTVDYVALAADAIRHRQYDRLHDYPTVACRDGLRVVERERFLARTETPDVLST
jgi:hypothetical protein